MKLIDSLAKASELVGTGSVATIGNFDGVHQGHQQLIGNMVARAKEEGLPSVVVTFSPHPERFFSASTAPPLVMPESSKFHAIAALGVDYILVLSFTHELASLSPADFVRSVLCKGLAVRHLFVGHDYAFGKGRQGNAAMLTELGKAAGFSLTQLPPVYLQGDIVSSTRIRGLVLEGRMGMAASLLGRPFFLEGVVGHGKNRGGKSLGFPTANLACIEGLLLPKEGVYAVRVMLKDKVAPLPLKPTGTALSGMTNVGVNPTFGDVPLGIETHLLDFRQDIYHTGMRVWFMARMRDEKAFSSLEALTDQLGQDAQNARSLL